MAQVVVVRLIVAESRILDGYAVPCQIDTPRER
jgi:hypothetical protein